MFFICWKSLKTGKQGRGTRAFPRDETKRYADELNVENKGLLIHWIERAAQPAPQADAAPAGPQQTDAPERGRAA